MKKFIKTLIMIAGVACVIMLLIPQVGPWVMVEELMGTLMMLCVVIGCCGLLITEKEKRRNLKGILWTGLVLIFFGWCVTSNIKDIVLDMVSGTETVVLYNCQAAKQSSYKGIVGLHYYLNGENMEGEKYRLEISGNACEELEGRSTVTVTCYKHVGRVVSY